MSVESLNEEPIMLSNKELKRVGRAVWNLLSGAVEENRVTCGLKAAIHILERDPDQIQFCVMPHTHDTAKHIQSTLLQAFCYEHNISIVKVDSVDRLRELVGALDVSCVLIHRNTSRLLCLQLELDCLLRSVEYSFVTQPVFKLPAK